ncbi:hypothetical protein KY363_00030 [Candidatus Woesearchaeota archaeon]|nr:hypothetical protein [Candidatus Woesearchaeota archaeon]
MVDRSIYDVLFEQELELSDGAEQIRTQTDQRIKEDIERITNQRMEQYEQHLERYTEEMQAATQAEAIHLLQLTARDIENRSREFSRNSGNPDIHYSTMRISFLYAHRDAEDTSKFEVLLPTQAVAPENGARLIPERMKAITLETLLAAKSRKDLPIASIAIGQTKGLTSFSVEFESPQNPEVQGLVRTYDTVLELDIILQDAFAADDIMNSAGVTFTDSQGLTLSRLDVEDAHMIGEDFEPGCTANDVPQNYITEDEAVDLMFGLSSSMERYATTHEKAKARFRRELKLGSFRYIFNDFEIVTSSGVNYYNRKLVDDMIRGEKEIIETSGESTYTVTRQFIVRTDSPEQPVHIFPCGAYSHEDVLRLTSLTEIMINNDFEDEIEEGYNADPAKKGRVVVERGGVRTAYYRQEDVEAVMKRRRKK